VHNFFLITLKQQLKKIKLGSNKKNAFEENLELLFDSHYDPTIISTINFTKKTHAQMFNICAHLALRRNKHWKIKQGKEEEKE